MHVLALRIDLRFPASQSLKEKRHLLKPVVEGARRRFAVSVAEIDHQDTWQRATIGIALVGGDVGVVEQTADNVERFVWQVAELEVLQIDRHWMET